MTIAEPSSLRLYESVHAHPESLTVRVWMGQGQGSQWLATLSDHQNRQFEAVPLAETTNPAHALAIADTHLLAAARPRTTEWTELSPSAHGTQTYQATLTS